MAPGVGTSQLAHNPEQDLDIQGEGEGVFIDHNQVGPAQGVKGIRPRCAEVTQCRWLEPLLGAPADPGHGHSLDKASPAVRRPRSNREPVVPR